MFVGLLHHHPKSAIQKDIFRYNRILPRCHAPLSHHDSHIFHLGTAFINAQLYLFKHHCNHVLFQGIISKLNTCQLFEDALIVEFHTWHFEKVLFLQRSGRLFLKMYDCGNGLVDCDLFGRFDKEHDIFAISISNMNNKFTQAFIVMANDLLFLRFSASPKGRSRLSIEQKLLLLTLKLHLEADRLAQVRIGDNVCRIQLEIDFANGRLGELLLHFGVDLFLGFWTISSLNIKTILGDVVYLERGGVEVSGDDQDMGIGCGQLDLFKFESVLKILPS
jgi:hypothetical protein